MIGSFRNGQHFNQRFRQAGDVKRGYYPANSILLDPFGGNVAFRYQCGQPRAKVIDHARADGKAGLDMVWLKGNADISLTQQRLVFLIWKPRDKKNTFVFLSDRFRQRDCLPCHLMFRDSWVRVSRAQEDQLCVGIASNNLGPCID